MCGVNMYVHVCSVTQSLLVPAQNFLTKCLTQNQHSSPEWGLTH